MTIPTTVVPATQAFPKHKFTFELVQIFRGFAAMLVVGYHCHGAMQSFFNAVPLRGIFAIGLFGVDFFFVLSGFIITYIHIADIRQQRNLVPFFKKRFFRIYPIYWVVALVALGYLVFVDKGKLEFADHTLSWASTVDWLYVIKSFLLFPQPSISVLDVSWTLSFEILFYLVFGLAILGGWRFARILFFTWMILILCNAFGLFTIKTYLTGFLLSPLIIEFLMGCLLAYVFKYDKIKLTLPLFIEISACLAAGAVVYLKIFNHQLGREGFNYIFIIGGAMLALWSSATIDKSRKFSGKNLSLLLLLGNASYSIYLTHTLLIKILFRICQGILPANLIHGSKLYPSLLFCILTVVTAAIGVLVHLVVEQPLLNYTNRRFVPERKTV